MTDDTIVMTCFLYVFIYVLFCLSVVLIFLS